MVTSAKSAEQSRHTEAYRSSFEEIQNSDGAARAWLRRLRDDAFGRFTELGFPTTRQEEWRFTNIGPIAKTPFQLPRLPADEVALDRIVPFQFGCEYPRLVFVNGWHAAGLSRLPSGMPDGVTVQSLAHAFTARSDAVQAVLDRHGSSDDTTFTALNAALIQDGAFIHVSEGIRVGQPIHLLFVSTSPPQVRYGSHPRNIVVIGRRTQATVIESYVALKNDAYFTNAVTEALLGEDSGLNLCKVQQESNDAYHIATTRVHQSANSRFSSDYVSLGGKLVRNEMHCVLDAEGCECALSGLYFATGKQHMDNRTRIDHAKPRCVSSGLYNGILDEFAQGVFNGAIYVHPDAQKTDARQNNRVLLLSDDAVIDTKPQLEIYADDVKCTHGAAVGQLDDEALFYLRSRGISRDLARSLLIYAFANEILHGLRVEPVRAHLQQLLLADQNLAGLSGE